ncbi:MULTISPECIES: hypothetical protein [Xanthomonas]|uniref:Uncharacterized protein n=1 Tax=Xanthomonas phaseoli pv. dieffenbachiae TaxID=92828 RepID=A0A1V9GYA5_9XANT|nr:hypothetical protein [Xanthomonas phaseoli]MBO9769518.1 hypothetical protein [Xanthomonas phaseoli pv. dieffenbachiae]MBO9777838.1 hypothetical protein [Xanthomonas phaseoli pv. dieffenbachiae]MBO9780201.1 hypothetical protein [Xanthomonas phaseoli pv. dieffenbachiae]MBO9788756.1 hypothetical protein [Xanthomonas phaseoli pv. dieffenbachiae]MBO9796046.1 hypothetical protein [Xanthomonas phaseoli pv. dieffenbachiae]
MRRLPARAWTAWSIGLGASGSRSSASATLGRPVIVQTTLPRLTRRFYRIQHRQKRLWSNLQRSGAHGDLHELRVCGWPPC